MTTTTAWLADLVQRVPVHVIDLTAARQAGDAPAMAYAEAMREWQREAAIALAEVEQGATTPQSHGFDPFARVATASALMRVEAAE